MPSRDVKLSNRRDAPLAVPGFAGIRRKCGYEYLGLPLWSIALGPDVAGGEMRGHAKGVIAIGDIATGILAIGGLARGFIAIGGFAVGIISFGGLAIGGSAFGGLGDRRHGVRRRRARLGRDRPRSGGVLRGGRRGLGSARSQRHGAQSRGSCVLHAVGRRADVPAAGCAAPLSGQESE
jgi:hypothetical protein